MKLYDVQKAALNASRGKPGFAYFMEQGLGKTATTYAELLELAADKKATRLVVVCPNSFKNGWVKEAQDRGLDFDFFIWRAGAHEYLQTWIKKAFTKPPVLIVNWEAIRAKKTRVPGTKKKVIWEATELMNLIMEFAGKVGGRAMITFDESIQAKTYDSAQTMGGIWLQGSFKYSRVLSGKPITQGPHDLWGQMRLIKQLETRNFYSFKTAFCRMGGYMGKTVIGGQNEDILAAMIEPHIFRATKADWTDLPAKIFTIREYDLTSEMAAKYRAMEEEFVLWLNDEDAVAVDAAITKYIKLAQIQCGWIYDEDGKVHWLVPDERNPRLNLLKETIETEVVGKVLIPYNHRPVYDQLTRTFPNAAYITGGMKGEDIEEQKRRFNEDPDVMHMFLQTKAAKYGHTLLGLQHIHDLACFTMAFYENTYSLDDRSQIEDRAHRHGQNFPVSYIDLVGTPLDRNCVLALQRKESVFQTVFAPLRTKRLPA